MQAFALIVVTAAGVWLVGVAFLMALRPRYSLQLFEKMSVNLERSNWRLQFTEQGLRVLAGRRRSPNRAAMAGSQGHGEHDEVVEAVAERRDKREGQRNFRVANALVAHSPSLVTTALR